MRIGANLSENRRCEFVVWAPDVNRVEVRMAGETAVEMEKVERGYWRARSEGVEPGQLYLYRLDDAEERPDPASHHQPEGVHGPSAVVAHGDFNWTDTDWQCPPLEQHVFYELHVGTFTRGGTFEAIIPRLEQLRDLGITAIELMPVAEFPGDRNWGYDGTYPFSVHAAYGGPDGLKRLVDASHRLGLAVVMDVVYNHLGPEGNYLSRFAPYFTDRYLTPWGNAVNFDGAGSDEVRNFFIENALHWLHRYHLDGLRLDATHEIHDQSAYPFLQELADRCRLESDASGRRFMLIAESDRNDPRLASPKERGGYGLDGQWCDDFHHALHALLTRERSGYYSDFGGVGRLVKAFREGFVYTGEYSIHRRRRHGAPGSGLPAGRFVVFAQNHDQTGNRLLGERLSTLVSFDAQKLAAGAVLLSPYVPLLFMGEEYGETAPFLYFVSHGDPDLVRAVSEGRRIEFEAFAWAGEPPDPAAPETFLRSKIDWERRSEDDHGLLLDFHRELLRLRREVPALSACDNRRIDVTGDELSEIVCFRRWSDEDQVLCVMNFSGESRPFIPDLPHGEWKKIIDSAGPEWGGGGSSMPELIFSNQEVTINGESMSVYVSRK